MNRRTFNTLLLLFAGKAGRVMAADSDDSAASAAGPTDPTPGPYNLQTPTWGGKQFWQDELVFHGWRIQRNCFTGHCRLLDDRDWRQSWGTFDDCRTKLNDCKRERTLPPMSGSVVILLHGLGRTRGSMSNLGSYLTQHTGQESLYVGYPTTRADVAGHARGLAAVIEHLEGVEQISFVAHSLGNLVIRRYLAEHTDPRTGKQGDPRIKRIVMLGPPNNGARLAEMVGQNTIFEFIVGASGKQLSQGWADLEKTLATPACEFGILAGGRGEPRGFNPLLKGDNDLIVTVESARLAGAADFQVLPVQHTFMMDRSEVQEATLRFIEHGYFVSADKRQPIART